MKKTEFIEFTKIIKKTLVSFISIIVFVLLGVGLFTGFSWGSLSLKDSAQASMVSYHLHDVEVISQYGFSDKDIERFKALDPELIINPFNYSYEICEYNDLSSNVKIYQITPDINQFQEINGVLPAKADEIAIPVYFAEKYDLKVGDTISFKHNWYRSNHLLYSILYKDRSEALNVKKDSNMKYLNSDTFVITATVNNILSMCTNEFTCGVSDETGCQVEAYFYVNECAFDKKSTPDYRGLWVYSNKLNQYKYDSNEYKDGCTDIINKFNELAYTLGLEKYEQIREGISYLSATDFEHGWYGYMGLSIKNYSPYTYSFTTRNQNPGVVILDSTYHGSNNIKWSLSSMLLAIAILVTYSAVQRIIFEQRVLIGTKKALGFSRLKITSSYLLYSLIATLIGGIIGFIVGRFIISPIILSVTMNSYYLKNTVSSMSIGELLITIAIIIVLILLSTFIACNKILKKDAVTLLSSSDQNVHKKRFYEKSKLWKKLPLLTKTIINNFFNDKRRVIGTIIGIVGSTSLMVCGITFTQNMTGTPTYHYNNIQSYDTVVYYNSDINRDVKDEINAKMDDINLTYANVYATTGIVIFDNDGYPIRLNVAEDESFDKVFHLIDENGNKRSINEDGIWISKSIAETKGIKPNSKIEYTDMSGLHTLPIAHIAEYYISTPTIFMNKTTYLNVFKTGNFKTNNMYLIKGTVPLDVINRSLNDIIGYQSTYDIYTGSLSFLQSVNSGFTMMSLLYIVMSIFMALLVVLNLLVTFVMEKKRDIIVLRINGYQRKQAKKYIYADTIFLTILGIGAGIGIGYLFAYICIKSVANVNMIYLTSFNFIAMAAGIVTTALLVTLMSYISLKKIDKFELTDISKD